MHVYLQLGDKEGASQQYQKEFENMKALKIASKFNYFILPAVGLVIAEYSANTGFGIDPCNAGVNSSVITMDTILVLIFFWFYSGEHPSLFQFVGTSIAISGAVLNGWSDSGGNHANAIAIAWCLCATVGFALNIISSRFASSAGVGNMVPWAWQQIVVGVTAILMCFCQIVLSTWAPSLKVDTAHFLPTLVYWSVLGACAQSLGIYSVILSFQGPDVVAGVNGAIFGSCDLVNFALDWFLLGSQPNMIKRVSMAIIAVGVIIMSIAS